MKIKIAEIISAHFIESYENHENAPMWFGRCGPFYVLKSGFRTFINDIPVNFAGYNNSNKGYFLYYNRDNASPQVAIPSDTIVEFRLDKLVWEPVVM